MSEKLYSVGEIFRKKMLLSHIGEPYKDRATVLRVVRSLAHKRVKTPFGLAYGVSQAIIKKHNINILSN